MSNFRKDRQAPKGMFTSLAGIFSAPSAATAGRRPAAAPRPQSRAKPLVAPAPHSRLQQAVCHALLVVALASAMGVLLAAYNASDSIRAQAEELVMVMLLKG